MTPEEIKNEFRRILSLPVDENEPDVPEFEALILAIGDVDKWLKSALLEAEFTAWIEDHDGAGYSVD
jgi:hypothetical protein